MALEGVVVVDASAIVDLLLGQTLGAAVSARLDGHELHAPAHLEVEVLSALGRLHRAGELATRAVGRMLSVLAAAPIRRHPLPDLLSDSWRRRDRLRLSDALYVSLAARLVVPLVTTDSRLGRATSIAEVVQA